MRKWFPFIHWLWWRERKKNTRRSHDTIFVYLMNAIYNHFSCEIKIKCIFNILFFVFWNNINANKSIQFTSSDDKMAFATRPIPFHIHSIKKYLCLHFYDATTTISICSVGRHSVLVSRSLFLSLYRHLPPIFSLRLSHLTAMHLFSFFFPFSLIWLANLMPHKIL